MADRSQGTAGSRDPGPLRREQVVETLCAAFAEDRIDLPALESGLDRANRAASDSELRNLLSDLNLERFVPNVSPGSVSRWSGAEGSGTEPGSRPATPGDPARTHRGASGPSGPGGSIGGLAHPAHVRDRQVTVAFWSGRSRKGSWVPARRNVVVALQGGIELDFREAIFGPGVTEVHAVAVMGAVEILVPPGVHLESSGFALMGAFDDETEGSHPAREDQPILRLSGFALMGAVEVQVRLPGESAREARARRKRERRDADPTR